MTWDYIAGFWDGEGWVAINAPRSRQKSPYVNIGACQSTPQDECLKEIQKFLYDEGIPSKIYIAKSNGPRRHPVSKLYVTGHRNGRLEFLKQLLPLAIVKKSAIEIAVAVLEKTPVRNTQFYPEERKRRCESAYSDYRNGLSQRNAAKKNEIAVITFERYLRKNNLPTRTRGTSIWITRRSNGTNAIQSTK